MQIPTPPRRWRAWLPKTGAIAATCALTACQSYQPAPLDIAEHRATLDTRVVNTEPITRFIERLAGHGSVVPDHFDPADGLSLAEGEVLALFYNAELRLARLDAGVARATFETAGLWEDPVFGFDGAEILSPAAPFESGFMVNLTIPVSGRLSVKKDKAGAAYESHLRRIVDAEWNTRARVREAWATWTVATERLRLLQEVIGGIERIARITDQLEAAGELTRVEARLVRAELVKTRSNMRQAELAEAMYRQVLVGLVGLPPDTSLDLLLGMPQISDADMQGSSERLIRTNTVLAVRRAEYQVAEESLRLEIRKQYPDMTVGGGFGSEDKDERLLLGVSIPIPILNANRAAIADATARRALARASAEVTLEHLEQQLAMSHLTYTAAREQRLSFERDLVPMLDEQTAEVESLADLGEVDTLILLETVTRRYEAKSRILDLTLAECAAAIEINRLLGPDKPMVPAPISPNQNSDRRHHSSVSPLSSDTNIEEDPG